MDDDHCPHTYLEICHTSVGLTDVAIGPFTTPDDCAVCESDEHWKCYLQLLQTVTLATSHEVTEGVKSIFRQ